MLELGTALLRTCSGLTRREVLAVGGLGLFGLGLPDLLRSEARAPTARRRETSVILLWLDGGPSHFETFDPKPETPDPIRGPYGAIKTSLSGVPFCELLPHRAPPMNRSAVIPPARHGIDSHPPIPTLTAGPTSTTSWGAVVARLKGAAGEMPPYVHVGSRLPIGGGVLGSA